MKEKEYVKTAWVDNSEPDMDAEHMNNIEDGISGLYAPEFDDSGTVPGIASFPDFLATLATRMNPFAFYKNLKAGLKFILHTGQLVNNGLCNEPGKYPLDAAFGKSLQDQINMQSSNLTIQSDWTLDDVNSTQSFFRIGGISPSTASNIGISGAKDYMQVVNIPWNAPYPTQLITTVAGKQDMYLRYCINGTWDTPKKVLTHADITYIGGATKLELGYDYTNHKDYMGIFYDNGNRTVISFTDTGIQCDVLEGTQWRTKWTK